MIIDKAKLWNIVEKYDCKEYSEFCDAICDLILNKKDNTDLLTIYNYYDKIDLTDRVVIESQVGNKIDYLLFAI